MPAQTVHDELISVKKNMLKEYDNIKKEMKSSNNKDVWCNKIKIKLKERV